MFLVLAASYLPETVVGLLVEMDVRSLVSPWKFKQAWFARFWRYVNIFWFFFWLGIRMLQAVRFSVLGMDLEERNWF